MKVEAPLVVSFVLDSAAELEELLLSELVQSLIDWHFELGLKLIRSYWKQHLPHCYLMGGTPSYAAQSFPDRLA
ncbi:hypothetical protein OFO11_39700, partial [Escherichia coli]|nr:hypothetical protein [Escherichia coli]